MRGAEIRGFLGMVFLSAFTVLAIFFLLDPYIDGTIETITINTAKYYFNLGWLKTYYATLLLTFVFMIFFMDKNQVGALILGLVLGSVPLLEKYRLPGTVRVLNLFHQETATNLQTYLPYVAVLLGVLVVFGLLKLTNRIFR